MPLIAEIGRPSWRQGFARSAAESAYPELWQGLQSFWPTSMGSTGVDIPSVAGYEKAPLTFNDTLDGGDWTRIRGKLCLDFRGDGTQDATPGFFTQGYSAPAGTIAAWVRNETSPGGGDAIIFARNGSGNNDGDISLYFANAGNYSFLIQDGVSTYLAASSYSPQVNAGWDFVVGTWDENTATRVYCQGVLSGSGSAAPLNASGGATPYIGSFNGTSTADWNGGIADVAFWDRALTAQEVMTLWHEPLAPLVPRRRTVFNVPAVAPAGAGFPFQYYYSTGSL